MNKQEEQTVRNVAKRLRGNSPDASVFPRCSPEIDAMLKNPAMRRYLDTWVVGALECLLPEQRDLRLAVSLSS